MSAPSVFPYFGGKKTLARQIVELLPPHQHYVEPFCGSLAVLLAKPRARLETVNDLDGDLMSFWRVLRDQPEELAHVCDLTPFSRTEYDHSFERDGCTDLERARRVWVSLTQGRLGTLARKTGWRFQANPAARSSSQAAELAGYVRKMREVADRLHGVTLESRPATDLIADCGRHEQVLIYVDPPYLGSTRNDNGDTRNNNGRNYRVDMPSGEEHETLAAALTACRSTVVLSGYPSPLYDELYKGWHRHEITSATSQGGTGEFAARTEVLWSNNPLGQQASLFDGVA